MLRLLPFAFLLASCANERLVLTDHLVACGFLTPGDRSDLALANVYVPTSCYEQCFARASCEEIEATLCRTAFDLAFACDQECAFRCDDGAIVGVEQQCNGTNNCADSSDERGCTNIILCDGRPVSGALCDDRADCWDGSDERSCPGAFLCNGREAPASTRCDGRFFCPDGSDERDCPMYRCANGRMFAGGANVRCDGFQHCEDGSDEAGCARLILMCTP